MIPSGHTITIEHLGRPPTANQAHRMHPLQVAKLRRQYREAAAVLARAHKIPAFDAITVTAHGEYPNRRSLPDVDAIAPAVKPVIDGLVDAGVIADDNHLHVHSVTYLAPRVVPGCTPALVVTINPSEET